MLRFGASGENKEHGGSDGDEREKTITVKTSGGQLSWREKRRVGMELRGMTSGN
jgi:hypothetical protein